MPPLMRIISSSPPASSVMMISSPMPVMPWPMPPHHSISEKLPVASPITPEATMPSSSTFMTFMPAMAVTRTSR